MTTKELVARAKQDEALRRQMAECRTIEEGYAVAREAGLTDDQETFVREMKAMQVQSQRELSDAELAESELSDAELVGIAGGSDAGDTFYQLAMYCLV